MKLLGNGEKKKKIYIYICILNFWCRPDNGFGNCVKFN